MATCSRVYRSTKSKADEYPSALQNHPVAITHSFVGLPVADYAAAYDWYVRLLGREADMFPHETESVWQLTPASSIYVAQDSDRAGSALVSLALDDLDAHERRLREAGFTFTVEARDAAPRQTRSQRHRRQQARLLPGSLAYGDLTLAWASVQE